MQNKPRILLTGATSGIGQAIARCLAADYPLVLHGRYEEKLSALKKTLASANPVETWTCDLADTAGLKSSLKEFLAAKAIKISGFVHCAGMLKIMAFKNFREDFIREIFNVNLFSAVEILQTLLSKTNISYLNRVVFISSLSSRRGDRGNTMYAASKGALDSLVRSLAIELAPDITVNSVLPGTIETEMSRAVFANPQQKAELDAKYPLGAGKPDDVASMVKFLLSSDAR
ncbi:MAG: SDR family oxidoreductase, partial [Dysgonamonadaceae bacterium]|nr:SDR family oxidoreductase [Dysgonamonadaceae bacterium]